MPWMPCHVELGLSKIRGKHVNKCCVPCMGPNIMADVVCCNRPLNSPKHFICTCTASHVHMYGMFPV